MDKIKIIIVDDHDVYRDGLRMNIEFRHPDIVIVGEAKFGADFFSLLQTPIGASADVVLLDIGLTDMSGIDIARRLKTERPAMKILTISAENTVSNVEKMLDIGIEGFVSKFNCTSGEVIEAIRAVAQGLDYFGEDISTMISQIYIAKKKTMQVTNEFSEQEQQIIECCHEGLRAKQIADRLCIATKTVEWYKYNIFQKLGINSTKEMVQYALKNGIIRIVEG